METYEFDEATEKKIEQFEKSLEDVQADIIKYSITKQEPVFAQRDEILKGVDNFWVDALYNCPAVAVYLDDVDREAMSHLTQIRVERNKQDPREATIHFDFSENSFFSDKTLSKSFKVAKDAEPLGSDDFDFGTQSEAAKISINWKSDEKNLSKSHPTKFETNEDGDVDADEVVPGSIFSSFFEADANGLSSSIGDNLINEFYPRAHQYYVGTADDDPELYEDYDSEDEEDEDDDDREIDLEDEEDDEKPSSKKAKHG